jgi:hypothetical protein
MAQYYLVKADADFFSLFAHELEGSEGSGFKIKRNGVVLCDTRREQFFGNLSSLLLSRGTERTPMQLDPPDAEIAALRRVVAPIHDADAASAGDDEPLPPEPECDCLGRGCAKCSEVTL